MAGIPKIFLLRNVLVYNPIPVPYRSNMCAYNITLHWKC